jgi:hypothetical protein
MHRLSPTNCVLIKTDLVLQTTQSIYVYEICALLGYYAALNGSSVPTFRDDLSVPSLRVKKSKKEGAS